MYRRLLLIIAIAFTVIVHMDAVGQQEGKLMILVEPEHSYIYVDGQPLGDSSQMVRLPAGSHTVAAYNYGYSPQSQDVTVEAGKSAKVRLDLQSTGEKVAGPRGRIQIEGAPRAAIFLNGKTPGYFVGHADEFDNNFISWQQLIVPPGTYQLTAIDKSNKEIWSGPVTVAANQKVIVDVSKGGQQRVKEMFPSYKDDKALPRSKTDFVSNTIVAVAPVSGTFSAETPKINCGDSSRLVWSSKEAVDAQITETPESGKMLPPNGDLTIKPIKTTEYAFQVMGPGGVVKSNATVEVDPTVHANIEASPGDVHYRKIGEKVIKHDSTNLRWTTEHSDSITVEPVGVVSPTGSHSLQPMPKQTAEGPVDETVTYTLVAKNVCGGSETKTANVHVTGSIEPVPKVALASVFFPTGYPTQKHPQIGLVKSQQTALSEAAKGFKAYLEYDPEAKLQVIANADQRDSKSRNQVLSERRAERVRQYLIDAGIPSDKIDVMANGEDKQLSLETIKSLELENPDKRPMRNVTTIVWAYNRRVDLLMVPKGAEPVVSVRFFPNKASEAKLLRSPAWQGRGIVQKATGPSNVQAATVSANKSGGQH